MWRGLLELLFPRACAACGLLPAPGPFCGDCAARLEVPPVWRCVVCAGPLPLPEGGGARCRHPGRCADCAAGVPFAGVRAAFVHGGAASEAIHRLKYRGRREVARTLAPLLAAAALPDRGKVEWIAPIPLHPSRRRERGFDQALLLAAALAPALDLPLCTDLLVRERATARQVGLDREERLRNLEGAFRVIGGVRGRRIAIVDDVVTTGATARAAAAALRAAGALEVRVFAFARAGH